MLSTLSCTQGEKAALGMTLIVIGGIMASPEPVTHRGNHTLFDRLAGAWRAVAHARARARMSSADWHPGPRMLVCVQIVERAQGVAVRTRHARRTTAHAPQPQGSSLPSCQQWSGCIVRARSPAVCPPSRSSRSVHQLRRSGNAPLYVQQQDSCAPPVRQGLLPELSRSLTW